MHYDVIIPCYDILSFIDFATYTNNTDQIDYWQKEKEYFSSIDTQARYAIACDMTVGLLFVDFEQYKEYCFKTNSSYTTESLYAYSLLAQQNNYQALIPYDGNAYHQAYKYIHSILLQNSIIQNVFDNDHPLPYIYNEFLKHFLHLTYSILPIVFFPPEYEQNFFLEVDYVNIEISGKIQHKNKILEVSRCTEYQFVNNEIISNNDMSLFFDCIALILSNQGYLWKHIGYNNGKTDTYGWILSSGEKLFTPIINEVSNSYNLCNKAQIINSTEAVMPLSVQQLKSICFN